MHLCFLDLLSYSVFIYIYMVFALSKNELILINSNKYLRCALREKKGVAALYKSYLARPRA